MTGSVYTGSGNENHFYINSHIVSSYEWLQNITLTLILLCKTPDIIICNLVFTNDPNSYMCIIPTSIWYKDFTGKKNILHQLTQTLLTGFLNPILNFQIKNPNEITDVYI